ncbi:MAG: hypothetical protein CML17_00835, partial [Pusillimonas sp.]|nr:hypothetical protein [Pusillimonas sp.]
ILKINEKNESKKDKVNAYIGLAGIKDFNKFWASMEHGIKYGSIKIGEAYGLNKLIESSIDVQAKKFTWYDTGNLSSLKIAKEKLTRKDAPEILEKKDEAIWFVNDKVIKYNNDKNFILNRVNRAKKLKGFVPEIIFSTENMYSYREITGQVLSKVSTRKNFVKLMSYLDSFWKLENTVIDEELFKSTCLKFYKDKTEKRTKLYFDRYGEKDTEEVVNGEKLPTLKHMLDKIDWDWMSTGKPVRFHGDLHFENILLSETGDFFLLDWRQDFGGLMNYGDLYYDLAKLLHGLIMSHSLVNKNLFTINKVDNVVKYDFHRKNILVENEKQLENFVINQNLDWKKVRLLTALVFLNIAPLHHYPYSKLLFYLGKDMLYSELRKNNATT